MSKVKVLYVKNLTAGVTEQILRDIFGEFGALERVKKIKVFFNQALD
jgi:RNA recognition motif-containing protein